MLVRSIPSHSCFCCVETNVCSFSTHLQCNGSPFYTGECGGGEVGERKEGGGGGRKEGGGVG